MHAPHIRNAMHVMKARRQHWLLAQLIHRLHVCATSISNAAPSTQSQSTETMQIGT